MRHLRGIVAIALLLVTPVSARAGIEKAGTTAANFLSLGAGADVAGMGGATLGFGGGLGSAAWNVAALGSLPGTHYVFSHAAVTGESPQDWVAAGGRFGTSRTRWGLNALYQGDGVFEGRDVNNVSTGTFNASSMALGFQVAQPLSEMVTAGLGIKYASENLGGVTGGGVTFDAGLRVQAGAIGFGAAAQNAFGKMSYGGASYDFPTSYGAGVSYQVPTSGLTFALDANFPNAYYSDVRGGVEWRYHDRLALRTGYRKEMGAGDGEPLGGPTFGMGAGANGFWLDYGFLTGGASGSGQHRVGLTYRPGFMNGDATEVADARRPSREATLAQKSPTYVERAKAARASTPATPKPATPSRAPEVVAPPASKPAPTAKAVAPAKDNPSKSTSVREPENPAVAAPAPINSTSAKAEPATPSKSAPETPAKLEAVAKPASIVTPPAAKAAETKEAAKPAKADDAKKTAKAEAPAKTDESAKAKKAEEPVVASKVDESPRAVKSDETAEPKSESAPKSVKSDETAKDEEASKLENAPKPVAPKVEEKPSKPEKSEPEAPAGPRPDKVKVKPGQTLADIAKEWGNTVPALMMENNLVSEKVKTGQWIVLPKKGR